MTIPELLRQLVMGLLVLLNGVLITRIMTGNMIIPERTYTPVIIYTVISCGLYISDSTIIPLITSSILICSFDMMIRSFRRVVKYDLLFNAAMLQGLGVLIYPPTVIYIPMLFVALVIFKKGFREWIIGFTGVLFPWLLCSYIYWGMGHDFLHPATYVYNILSSIPLKSDYVSILLTPQVIVLWLIVSIIATLSLIEFITHASYTRTRPYKLYVLFIWGLVLSLILTVPVSGSDYALPLLAIPLSVILPNYFCRTEGWIPNLIYFLFLGSVVICNVIHL